MKGEKYAGLITENSITRWIAENRANLSVSFNLDEVRVSDVIRYEEARESWTFVKRNSSVDQVMWLFATNKALEAVMIEEKVEKSRRLIGIVTRWDISELQRGSTSRFHDA